MTASKKAKTPMILKSLGKCSVEIIIFLLINFYTQPLFYFTGKLLKKLLFDATRSFKISTRLLPDLLDGVDV